MLRTLGKWLMPSPKGTQSTLPPLPSTFPTNGAYWQALDRREAAYRARRIVSAPDESKDVDRRDWWGNYPGVASRLWRNFIEAFQYAAAGEWRDADATVELRCIPYECALNDPAFRIALQEESPAWVHVSIGDAWSAMAMARSWCKHPGSDKCLERSVAALIEQLKQVTSTESGDWEGFEEFLAIKAMSMASIAKDLAAMEEIRRLLSNVRFQTNHAALHLHLIESSFDTAARTTFEAHFSLVRSRTSSATRWKRPEGFDAMLYLVLCAVLSERMAADWEGAIDWRSVIGSVVR